MVVGTVNRELQAQAQVQVQREIRERHQISDAQLNELVRSAGLKFSVARVRVFRLIEAAGASGLNAQDAYCALHAKGTPVSLGTVARVMRDLESLALLHCREDAEVLVGGATRKLVFRLPS